MALLTSDMLRRLEQMQIVSRRMATGRMRGERRSKQRGYSTDFADYRNYVVGDDTRYLDWKIYARLEKLYLKLFLEEEDLRIFILIDCSKSMDFGDPNKLLYAKRVAAALSYTSLCKMDSVTIHAFGNGIESTWGPKRGKANAMNAFDFLETAGPFETTDFTEAARVFAQSTRQKGIAILISDFYDFNGYEHGLRTLFGHNFELFAIQLLSPDEIKPDLTGDVRLVDSEFDTTTDVSLGRSLLAAYEKTLNAFSHGLRNYVLARGGYYMLCSTELPFDRLVLDVLCRKGLVQ
jgi:uncharacterized protein (DUF58 family)